MLRFQQLDQEIHWPHQQNVSSQITHNYQQVKNEFLLRQTLTDFIQEGIGALLAYLPNHVAVQTLNDFLTVIGGNAHTSQQQSERVPSPRQQQSYQQPVELPDHEKTNGDLLKQLSEMKTQQTNMMEAIANMQKSSPQARTQQEFSQHRLQRERPQSIHSLQQEQPKVME